MKRILLSVFAAALTAAWVVPAGAADVTFSGQYRLRGEYTNNLDFSKDGTNDNNDFWGQRVRLTANAKATDDTSVKITLQDTRNWGAATAAAGGPALTDSGSNTVDLHESYVNVNNLFGAPVSLRAGRQELNYGDQRLVGSFGWNNNGRSFDALKFTYASEMVDVDLFESKLAENGAWNADQDFFGAYATVKSLPNNTLDVYFLTVRNANGSGFQAGNTTVLGTATEPSHLYTYGARLKGAVAGLDYTLELPIQSGSIKTSVADYKISAYAYAIKVGYELPTPVKVRVGAEYDFASGDKDNTNDKIKTFYNLFPTNHGKFGIMDQQGWRNTRTWNINAKVDATEQFSVAAAYYNFSLAEKQDAWYSAGNWNNTPTGLRAASAANGNSSVGSEIDIVGTYKYNNAVSAELGLARFFAGKFIKDRVANKADADFAYLMLTANF